MTTEYIQPGLPGTPIPSRPKESDQYVLDNAIDELCDSVIEWLQQAGEEKPVRAEVIEDLKAAIDNLIWETDGYKIAKELDDRHHWDCDKELVEILDNYDTYLDRWHDKALKSWVKAYDVKPQYAVGDLITIMAQHGKSKPTETPGEIVKVHTETATYTVYCESLGHIRSKPYVKGEPFVSGTTGLIINFEDVMPAKDLFARTLNGQEEKQSPSPATEPSCVNP